jgi:hypothetical protein
MLLKRKMALLAKIETTYGVDSVPTGAANAMLVRNAQINPLTVEAQARELMRPYLGNDEDIVGAFYGSLSFEVEAAGSGAAGTAPKVGPLLRGCGMAEVVSAGVEVTYTPVSAAFESLTMHFNLDGVLHKFTGARGNLGFRGNNREATMWTFSFTGLFVPVVDAALPSVNYAGFIKPLAFNTANTPAFSLHGVSGASAVLRNLSIDLANQVSYRNLVNSEMVQILDRKPVGTIEMEATNMATKNWWNAVRDSVTGALALQHGATAGNIIEINAPAVQITAPNYSDFEGAAMMTGGLKLQPTTAGNDEIEIVFR